jgi:hypothetical protein
MTVPERAGAVTVRAAPRAARLARARGGGMLERWPTSTPRTA